ncbi:hypothetical protein [Allocoleopsis franciscana]|uniref:Uncharacterized protein n=1 Tax=Allocoleopsis franciscana PCC 7113 TaxID=1173027 RepID=K9W6M8_9CYAN|nr:hypothetical protein [Allocoleopsis franciscana]AFZ16020.1 hypothetical protein Mic7113_0079 [Allocoleopsis franciscana PCC 7113]
MEYWEFLLQKEGDRTWLPINSKTEIKAGRYRVVAHSSRINTDVEICITHDSTEEVPPKRRSQKRSRRTNPEGLMVVIPFTYLRPGFWEFRCCGDIMSDFLGNSWQQSVQLVVLAEVTPMALPEPPSALLAPAKTEIEADLGENEQSLITAKSDLVEPTPIETEIPQSTPIVASDAIGSEQEWGVEKREEEDENTPPPKHSVSSLEATPLGQQDEVPQEVMTSEEQMSEVESEIIAKLQQIQASLEIVPEPPADQSSLQPLPTASTSDSEDIVDTEVVLAFLANQAIRPEPAESEENDNTLTVYLPEVATSTNPILDQSLQMLEQILQQVLEPVMQEFERPEPSQPLIVQELEELVESTTNQQGLLLTLDEEALVARRGECLRISGQVDVLDVNQLSSGEISRDLKTAFQGSLRYELRDPQSSRILLEVQQPLPEQPLPIAFRHTLEIPSDCPTRLILGKVTLYDRQGHLSNSSTSVALASQPFSVTADLEELLGAIIPGTQAMPVAKVLVLAQNLAPLSESQEGWLETSAPSLDPPVLDLVDVTQSHPPLSLKPSSASPLPPQLYQPTVTSKPSRSPQLPKLPKVRSISQSAESLVGSSESPVGILSELESVKFPSPDAVEPTQPLSLPEDSSSTVPKSLVSDTPQDTTPEPQLQNALQQLEVAISQIQSAGSLSSKAITQSVPPQAIAQEAQALPFAPEQSDSPIPVVESPNNGSLKDSTTNENELAKVGTQDSLDIFNADFLEDVALASKPPNQKPSSEVLEGAEDVELTGESPLEEAEEIDEWAISIYSSDSSLTDSDVVGEQMLSTEMPPMPEQVAGNGKAVIPDSVSQKEAITSELGLTNEPSEPSSESVVVDNAFQSLNIQDRFWSRLNSIAADSALSKWLSGELSPPSHSVEHEADEAVNQLSESEPVGINVEEVTQPLTSNTLLTDFDEAIWEEGSDEFDAPMALGSPPEGMTEAESLQPPSLDESFFPKTEIFEPSAAVDITDTDWSTQSNEFVVDDEDLAVPETPMVTPEVKVKTETIETVSAPVPLTPQLQQEIFSPRQLALPIPAPELSIPTSKLAAGELVTLRVTLPPHPARLCVKLWVQDRQSRSLLDGPRWLMDLIPDRTGEQEALTQLTVPFGSVEIRFEAIAVDIDSQRESRKVAVDCVVVPSNLSDFSLDEFEL